MNDNVKCTQGSHTTLYGDGRHTLRHTIIDSSGWYTDNYTEKWDFASGRVT
ncbi:MAG: hypothetical protein LBQ27_06725 [Clostridiales bacterium]|nr:hypothetical protein [Clostridiales bacterium]